jgi:5''/3''-nucleotidase SurE
MKTLRFQQPVRSLLIKSVNWLGFNVVEEKREDLLPVPVRESRGWLKLWIVPVGSSLNIDYLCTSMKRFLMKKRPLILLSNDDGYTAPGIVFLIDVLRPYADLVVVAPQSGRSGMSGAITVKVPLNLILVSEEEGLSIYRSNGTPVDCVKLALNQLFTDIKPDLVLSGINHGTNSSVAIHYSGTLGAVMEACMNGIPAIGLSLDDHKIDADFEPARKYIEKIARLVLEKGLPEGHCLNVNIPAIPELKGIRLCRQARGRWVEEFDMREHPNGGNYYWLTGHFQNDEPLAEDTDMYAMNEGFISVVPSQIDMTAYRLLETMKSWDL